MAVPKTRSPIGLVTWKMGKQELSRRLETFSTRLEREPAYEKRITRPAGQRWSIEPLWTPQPHAGMCLLVVQGRDFVAMCDGPQP
jgi:hypothetical protein